MTGALSRPGAGSGRQEILDAAAIAFDRKGYAATSIDDIADELEATKGRVYHYYRAKADIFLDVLVAGMDELIGAVGAIAATDTPPVDRLGDMVRQHVRVMTSRQPYQRVTVQAIEFHLHRESPVQRPAFDKVLALRDQYEQLFADVIDQGKREGVFRDVVTRFATKEVLGALNWISVWYDSDRPGSARVAHLAEEYVSFVVGGLRCRAGA